ncbi:MAG: hypothetical protein FJ137_09555 [Deltaproteobacteria bacterium]|nr:hypothetical protein [Deltaproteobacteria bacterium]
MSAAVSIEAPSSSPAPAGLAGRVGPLLVGTALGVVLSRVGFTRFAELQAMLTLSDSRMVGAFAGAVTLSAVLYRLRGDRATPGGVAPRVVLGGVAFGVGWAIAGACPGVVFAQLGEGQWWAAASLVGLLLGTRLGAVARERLGG